MDELHVRSRGQRQGEIIYAVHPRVWGQGVGTAIGQELLSTGFEDLELHRIYATCDPRNLGSARVLGKLRKMGGTSSSHRADPGRLARLGHVQHPRR
ncbi:GNAT family protein [Streptomyces ficellus]|uniref:GNAT family protein n=2 Tax=Streptomyces ficellus TaxID=1977088 RepID=A0ABT7ZA51_9ACTN|nr:GNAT family protein [Streptomyces ficellus]MDN3296384.1 GNAT family protein [Streptomyces ficellus]